MKSLNLIYIFLLSFVLASCENIESLEINSNTNKDYIDVNLSVSTNIDLATRSGYYNYTFDNYIYHAKSYSGTMSESNLTIVVNLPNNFQCQIIDETGHKRTEVSLTASSNRYSFSNIRFKNELDPSKIKLRFLNFGGLYHFISKEDFNGSDNAFTADLKYATYYGESYLAQTNDWESIEHHFTLENLSAQFIIFSDEFSNKDDTNIIYFTHSLDYIQDRDYTSDDDYPNFAFNKFYVNMDSNEIRYEFNPITSTSYDPLSIDSRTQSWNGASGALINRKYDNYITNNGKKVDIVGFGTIFSPFTNKTAVTSNEQVESYIEKGSQLKYLVLNATETLNGSSVKNHYKSVIPLSSLKFKKNCLYIIRNKAGKSIYTKQNESTRGSDDDYIVNLDDIEITEIPR